MRQGAATALILFPCPWGTHLHPACLLLLPGPGTAILLGWCRCPGWRQQQCLELLYLGLEAQAQHLVCLIQHAVLHVACRRGGGAGYGRD